MGSRSRSLVSGPVESPGPSLAGYLLAGYSGRPTARSRHSTRAVGYARTTCPRSTPDCPGRYRSAGCFAACARSRRNATLADMELSVGPAESEAERALARAIRHAVFVEEQGVPVEEEIDGLDDQCRHF